MKNPNFSIIINGEVGLFSIEKFLIVVNPHFPDGTPSKLCRTKN